MRNPAFGAWPQDDEAGLDRRRSRLPDVLCSGEVDDLDAVEEAVDSRPAVRRTAPARPKNWRSPDTARLVEDAQWTATLIASRRGIGR